MNNDSFPIVGLCQICGNGTDATTGLTNADAPARTTNKVLLPLVRYNRMYVCERCKKNDERESQSRRVSRQSRNNDKFLRDAGVKVVYE